MQSNNVLCIDDDPQIGDLIDAALTLAGYKVSVAQNGAQGVQLAITQQPQVILLDLMLPDMRGDEVLRVLKANPRTATIPVIFLSALDAVEDRVRGLERGADDYIGKPFAMKELLARIRTQLRHAEEHLLSELTGLPGNTQIQRALRQELENPRRDLYMLYADIDRFKSFNDTYGFLRGNELIKLTADLLRAATPPGDAGTFVGHIGGDDFVLIIRRAEEEVIAICETILAKFDALVPLLYDEADRIRSYVETTDRQYLTQRYPLVTLSIGVVTNRRRMVTDEWEASSIAADLKRHAKLSPSSSYHVDQRTA